jgi:tRNA-splicing ligase RtcB (3'-phosphate/5'-hydroxy nucleic acid ligase)
MKWTKYDETMKIPIKSWCGEIDPGAMEQALNLSRHPALVKHVALMPDCHSGYGMPIGGVIACKDAVIPNAVGVDIGCGMGAVRTGIPVERLTDKRLIRSILDLVKARVPVGEGNAHKGEQEWDGFAAYLDSIGLSPGAFPSQRTPAWLDPDGWKLTLKNLGTLGGGNHFIELQAGDDGFVWLMLHSGSRNLGYRIASHYNKTAMELNSMWHAELPAKDLAFLPVDSKQGEAYLRDMQFALEYARENRKRMMDGFKAAVAGLFPGVAFYEEINIHHNYAAIEHHSNANVWVHRKGATSARLEETGIIPGSMGTPSYIVRGLGNPESFTSCSHGAGRRMGRAEASRNLRLEDCDKAMQGIVFDRWSRAKSRKKHESAEYDFGEAPLAYKDIEEVIASESDLVEPIVRLRPLGVVKG